MNIDAFYTIIDTPLAIYVSQDFAVNLNTSNEKVVKIISVNTSVSVNGSHIITNDNYIVQDKFDGNFKIQQNPLRKTKNPGYGDFFSHTSEYLKIKNTTNNSI